MPIKCDRVPKLHVYNFNINPTQFMPKENQVEEF